MTSPASAQPSSPSNFVPALGVAFLKESPLNPRKRFDPAALEELAASIREHGVITPILVRPIGVKDGEPSTAKAFEIAAGHRRFRASQLAGLGTVPVIIRQMSDVVFLETLNLENLQREDIHPLEEAQGYADLMKPIREGGAGYTAQRIADRLGMSVKYVYDRAKLLRLTPEAKKLFLAGRMEAGHAIVLARLAKEDQERAIDPENFSGNGSRSFGLWESEHSLFHPDEDDAPRKGKADPYEGLKPVSVRELDAWVAEHVRLDPARDVDPMLFPEIAERVVTAKEMNLRVIPITHEHMVSHDARSEEERTYGEKSWRRADGLKGSKKCDYAVVGYVAAGPGRGEAFNVCVRRDKCTVHWPAEVRAANARAKAKKRDTVSNEGSAAPSAAAKAKLDREAVKEAEEQARYELESARWKRARGKVVDRLVKHIKASPTSAKKGHLGQWVVDKALDWNGLNISVPQAKVATKHVPGTSADDIVRWLVCGSLVHDVANQHSDYEQVEAECKSIGFDLGKVLDEIEPLPAPAKPAPAAKKAKR